MKKYLFAFFTLCLCLFSCNKDQDTNPVLPEKVSPPTDTYLAFGDYDCPEAEDFLCNDIDNTIEEMLGDSEMGFASSGKLDRIINCITPVANCSRACSSVTLDIGWEHLDGSSFPWIWVDGGEPCGNDFVFSAQEQEDFLQEVELYANEFAPMCGSRKMTPFSYDLFAETVSYTNYYIFARVTYISHCQRTRYRF